MRTLISIELTKLFHKKHLFIIYLLMLIFIILNNTLYKLDYDEDGNYKYEYQENINQEKSNLKEEFTTSNNQEKNIIIKTKLELLTLKEKFPETSWQYQKITDYLYELLLQINTYKLKSDSDVNQETTSTIEPEVGENSKAKAIQTTKLTEKQAAELSYLMQEYQLRRKKLLNDDWQYFINLDYQTLEEEKNNLIISIDNSSNQSTKQELELNLKIIQEKQTILNYRLLNNIKEDTSYLNKALNNYQTARLNILTYQTKLLSNQSKQANSILEDNKSYQEALKEMKINKYILDHKININQENSLSYQLRTITEDYEIFLIAIILITVNILICEEFTTGTIKLLLIKPHSRGKILLSKYFSAIIILLLSILLIITMQLIIGSFLLGSTSLTTKVIEYHYTKDIIIEYNIFVYMLIRIASRLPFFIMLMTITFLVGTISLNIITTIIMPFILYILTPTIENLAVTNNIVIFKYLINLNWNFTSYLFGDRPSFKFLNLNFSSTIYVGYFLIIGILTLIIFKTKNIKNV